MSAKIGMLNSEGKVMCGRAANVFAKPLYPLKDNGNTTTISCVQKYLGASQTSYTVRDCHTIKIEHDIIDSLVSPVHDLLISLK